MKKFFTLAIMAAVALTASAQPKTRNGMSEKMHAEKVAFITSFVGLTPEEAQGFWPVYNKFEAEIHEKMKAERDAYKALSKAVTDNAAEAEIKALSKAYIEAGSKKLDRMAVFEEYCKILPADKAAKVLLSEERFRRMQISRLGNNKGPKHEQCDRKPQAPKREPAPSR